MIVDDEPKRRRARVTLAHERGFTLIELLVVILIIGALAAIAIPSFLNQKGKAVDASAKELAHNAQIAAETYGTDNEGDYTNLNSTVINQYEAGILITSDGTDAYLYSAGPISGDTTGYTVVTAPAAGDEMFTITRDGGAVSRTCTVAGASGTGGGCVDGSW